VTPATAALKEKMTALHWPMITNGQVVRLKWSLSLYCSVFHSNGGERGVGN